MLRCLPPRDLQTMLHGRLSGSHPMENVTAFRAILPNQLPRP
jgi:hypothetical protein